MFVIQGLHLLILRKMVTNTKKIFRDPFSFFADYVGCFKSAGEGKELSSMQKKLDQNNSTVCVDFCLGGGFSYAGAKAG